MFKILRKKRPAMSNHIFEKTYVSFGIFILGKVSLILVLGGAGDMGSGVVEELCMRGLRVDIGDINIEKAVKLSEFLRNYGEVGVVKVNVASRDELIEVVKKYDVVVNTVGPFYKYGYSIASTLIEAGVNFIDICDDYDACENILSLSGKAVESNVTGITGLGWTPGISNILAKKGFEELGGDVNAVDIWWFGSAADSKGLAVVMHLFYALTGEVPMYLNGRFIKVKAGSSPEYVEFPGIGRLKLYFTGHPEPITLPRNMKINERVTIRGGLIPEWQNILAKFFIKIRLTSTVDRLERFSRFIHKIEDVFRSGGKQVSGVRVDVIKDGEKVSYVVMDRMRKLTSIPASIGAEMIVREKIKAVGVHPPEKIIDPNEFLQELQSRKINVTRL